METGNLKERIARLGEKGREVALRISARALAIGIGVGTVAALALFFYLRPPVSLEEPPESVTFFQVGTGSAGDEYFAVGERLAAAISRPPGTPPCEGDLPCGVAGLVAVAKSSAGPVANVRAVSAGNYDSALVAAPVLDLATRAETPFRGEKPITNLRAIAGVYREALYLVASRNANVATVADLEGKRVSVGTPGSGTREAALPVLAVNGLGRRTVTLFDYDATAAIELMLRGQLDAFFLVDALPSAEIASLADRGSIVIVPLEGESVGQLTRAGANFLPLEIPEDTYRFVPATKTLGVSMIWVVNEATDAELVYRITKALFYKGNRVLLSGPLLPGLLPGEEGKDEERLAIASLPIPLHEGAARYYREEGVLTAEEGGDNSP